MINIALPKGRLGEKIYDLFEKAGYECPAIKEGGRKLIFENVEKGVRYFWVKPSDVSIYVERGAADISTFRCVIFFCATHEFRRHFQCMLPVVIKAFFCSNCHAANSCF